MNLHGGDIYGVMGSAEGMPPLDYSSNINPYGPPPAAIAAAHDAVSRINRYPDAKQRALKEAYSRSLGVAQENIIFGNGASELIKAAFDALRPARVVIATPTFLEYARCARQASIPVVECPMNEADGFAPPIETLRSVVKNGDLLVVCQPNNPTGRAWNEAELGHALDMTKNGRLMVDECFVDLCHPAVPSCADKTNDGNVLVVRALTKNFSAPGLRVGYVLSDKSTTAKISDMLQPWPVNAIGEAFAIACTEGMEHFLSDSREKLAAERLRIEKELAAIGLHVFPSSVNYILLRSPVAGAELERRMLESGVLVRRCANFPGLDDTYVRIAVKDKASNDVMLDAFKKALCVL